MKHHGTRAATLGSKYLAPLTGMTSTPIRPCTYVPPVPDPTHVCGPWTVSSGAPMTCVDCGAAHPGSWTAGCLRGFSK